MVAGAGAARNAAQRRPDRGPQMIPQLVWRGAALCMCVCVCSTACAGSSARVSVRAGADSRGPSASSGVAQLQASSPAPPETPASIPLATIPPAASATPVASTGPAVAVYRGRTDTNAVALTFDAGADAGYTALILDTLRRNGIHATFGMTGQWAADNPELVRQMVADGHELINHTWDHRSFTGASTQTKALNRGQRWSELDRTEATVQSLTGQTTLPYFRAPFGDDDRSVEADAGARGYRYDILWTVDTGGWAGATVGQIIAKSAAGATPGAIIVMHVGAESLDGPALQGVIDAIRQKGLGFATISELVGGVDGAS
jgi:peptidoglycan/xylan/chitin deacetylase (PgdA/CDA1 family)